MSDKTYTLLVIILVIAIIFAGIRAWWTTGRIPK
jgi:hypothetical protein